MITIEIARSRVASGARKLDHPHAGWSGWREAIDVETLDMGRDEQCIGGQLDGTSFEGFLYEMSWRTPDAELWGFYVSSPCTATHERNIAELDHDYALLTQAWRELLTHTVVVLAQ